MLLTLQSYIHTYYKIRLLTTKILDISSSNILLIFLFYMNRISEEEMEIKVFKFSVSSKWVGMNMNNTECECTVFRRVFTYPRKYLS